MAYTAPTAADVKARYPAFDSLADATIEAVITEANRFVDDAWIETDYQPAIIHLTAHMLTMEGSHPDSPPVVTGGKITSEKLGDGSTTYGDAMDPAKAPSDWGATVYGRRYLSLLRVNRPAGYALHE